MQETAAEGRTDNRIRRCDQCDAGAQLRTPAGAYCPRHAWQIYFAEAATAPPDWIPWVIHRSGTSARTPTGPIEP